MRTFVDAYDDRLGLTAREARNVGLMRRRVGVERRLGYPTAAVDGSRHPTVLIAEPARADRELADIDAALEAVLMPRFVDPAVAAKLSRVSRRSGRSWAKLGTPPGSTRSHAGRLGIAMVAGLR